MLPKTHILLGAFFSALIWLLFPEIAWYNILLIFLSSFLIDFDHYMCAVRKNRSWSLLSALRYYDGLGAIEKVEFKQGIKKKGDFHIFHTVEFHLFVLLMGLWFEPFFFIFIGMVFHSLMDLISMGYKKRLYRREFLFSFWLFRRLYKTNKTLRQKQKC